MTVDTKKGRASLTPQAMSGAQDLVLNYLSTVNRVGRLLDMPAGQGYLAERARNMGFNVQCCDIDPDLFKLSGIVCRRVNLNRDSLPYESESFDFVASVGGLHRLFNPKNAIAEAWRVLVPGGVFIAGLKNYSSLRRRLLFLISGFHARNIITQSCHQTIDDPEANFRFPMTALHLFSILQNAGFSVQEIKTDGICVEGVMLFPLVLTIKVFSAMRRTYYSRKMDIEFSDPLGVIMGKKYMLVVSQKGYQ